MTCHYFRQKITKAYIFYSRESQLVPEPKADDHTLFSAVVGETMQAELHVGQ